MQIKPFTMSVVVGSSACNARCPFCVSKMTVENGVGLKAQPIDYRNWEQALLLAEKSGVTTILLTGKGEPTLFPNQISEVLMRLRGPKNTLRFPIIELQTNGIPIADGKLECNSSFGVAGDYLQEWYDLGLRTIAISNCGYNPSVNKAIYTPNRPDYIHLPGLIEKLHGRGFNVRLATVMIRNGIDHSVAAARMIDLAREWKVEQLTLRPVTLPHVVGNQEGLPVANWIESKGLNHDGFYEVYAYVRDHGKLLLKLPHGAEVYDVKGQNVCMSNCLTHSDSPDTIRQIIYFPDGHLRYSWEYEGAILL
jgi:hypothetical protein